MTSFVWGADAPMFDDRELRRMARQLRMALGAFFEEQPTRPDRAERQRPGQKGRGSRPTEGTEDRTDPRDSHSQLCGEGVPGLHHAGLHHWAAHRWFADEATREAWREHLRAARMSMMAEATAGREDAPADADDDRPTSDRGARGKGKHHKHRDSGAEGRPEREGGPRRGRGGDQSGPAWGPAWGGWGNPGRPGGPFGPFGPFGPGAGGPGRGMRGRGGPGWRFEGGRGRASRGDVRLAILALLSEGPRHGYQLIQDITERSEGAWAPSPGSIYPALSALQDEGLIDDEKLEGRRVFSLTDDGRAYVADREEQIDAVFEQNSPTSEHEALAEIGILMWGVGEAALTVLGTGTEAQRAEARNLLAIARRDLFRIMAEDTLSPETADDENDSAQRSADSTAHDTAAPTPPAPLTEPEGESDQTSTEGDA